MRRERKKQEKKNNYKLSHYKFQQILETIYSITDYKNSKLYLKFEHI